MPLRSPISTVGRDAETFDAVRALQALLHPHVPNLFTNARPVQRLTSALEQALFLRPEPAPEEWRVWDGNFGAVLDALDEVEATLRPAIEHARAQAAVLVERLEAEEAQRLADLAEEEREERFETEVQRRVRLAEEARLAAIRTDIENGVRKELATTTQSGAR